MSEWECLQSGMISCRVMMSDTIQPGQGEYAHLLAVCTKHVVCTMHAHNQKTSITIIAIYRN